MIRYISKEESEDFKEYLEDAKIHTEVMGSDHCPVELDIKL